MMTNKEFYGDKLLAIALEGVCHKMLTAFYDKERCAEKKCEDCKFYNIERIENWLNAEHVEAEPEPEPEPEPPLLENGDGLKPGDWIMVRNYTYDDWKKVRFMCYFDGYFFTTETFVRAINYKTCSVFTQARLPMEGE